MTTFDSASRSPRAAPSALIAALVVLATLFTVESVTFGDLVDEAAIRTATITVGVAAGTFLVRRAGAG